METPAVIYVGNLKPEYAKNFSDVRPTSFGTRLKKILMALAAALVIALIAGAICTGIGGSNARWPVYTAGGLFLLILGTELPDIFKSQQSLCPYCNRMIGNKASGNITRKDKNVKVECPQCFEWMISNEGRLRAFKKEDITDQTEFRSPLFQSGIWPDECIVCGEKVAKFGEAKNTSLNVGKLLVGRISVAWGSIKNVPYCEMHDDAVKMKVDDPDVLLIFKDYDARRRYLAMNPQRKPSKVK